MDKQEKTKNEMKTWADFAKRYDLVLFNQCVNLEEFESTVLMEWLEVHDCEAGKAGYHVDECVIPECPRCKDHKNDYGECPECNCEAYQWYAIGISEWGAEYLNKTYDMDIFYSDFLQIYILPVYHFGTAWDDVNLSKANLCPDCDSKIDEYYQSCTNEKCDYTA